MQSQSETHAGQNRAGGATPWLALALVLAVAAVISVWQTPRRVNHDCAIYLQMADMVLDGAVPYCGVVDVNPPLSTYLHVPPVWIAQRLGVSPIVVFQGCVIALLLLSACEMFLLVRKPRSGLRPAEQGAVLLAWMAMFFLVDWRGDVGQREHLFVLAYVPYLFLRILRYRRGSVVAWFALLLGLQAGVGISLKPHFLLEAAAVEMVLMLAWRRRRNLVQPECVALVAVVTAYVAHWLFVPAAMREAFFFRWVPLTCRGYRSFNESYWEMAKSLFASPFSTAGLLGVAACLLLLATRRRCRLRLHLAALATFAVMAVAVFYFQHKGFTYHRIPFDIAALLCLMMVGFSRMTRERAPNVSEPNRRAIWGTSAVRGLVLAVFGGFLVVWFLGRPGSARPDSPEYAALRRVVADHTCPGDRVLVISSSTRPAYPMLVQLGCRGGGRYLTAFPLAFLYAGAKSSGDRPMYHRYDEAPAEERLVLDEFRQDIDQHRPKLVVVNATPGWFGMPEGFNTFEYLVYSGWVDRTLKTYREVPGPRGWKVFERKSPPAGNLTARQ
jgi:hypothetical protein